MGEHSAVPTQATNPGRATIRTTVQVGIPAFLALLVLAPQVIQEVLGGLGQHLPPGLYLWLTGAATVITAASATITRVMAVPGVIEWTRQYLPWLAPDSK